MVGGGRIDGVPMCGKRLLTSYNTEQSSVNFEEVLSTDCTQLLFYYWRLYCELTCSGEVGDKFWSGKKNFAQGDGGIPGFPHAMHPSVGDVASNPIFKSLLCPWLYSGTSQRGPSEKGTLY